MQRMRALHILTFVRLVCPQKAVTVAAAVAAVTATTAGVAAAAVAVAAVAAVVFVQGPAPTGDVRPTAISFFLFLRILRVLCVAACAHRVAQTFSFT